MNSAGKKIDSSTLGDNQGMFPMENDLIVLKKNLVILIGHK